MDNFLITPTDPTQEEQDGFLISSTEEDTKALPVPDRYAREIAERYAERNGITFEEALVKTRSTGPSSVVQRDEAYNTIANTMVQQGIVERKPIEELTESINKINYSNQVVANSGNSVDYAETYAYDTDPYTSYMHDITLLSERIAARTEDQGWVGSAVSFVDAVFRDTLAGIPERAGASIFGMDIGISARTREAIEKLSKEKDPAKKAILADQIVDGWAELGFLNNNAFLMNEQLRSFTEGGLHDHEGVWTAVDIGTVGIGKLFKAGKTGKQTKQLASARDLVDKGAIVYGPEKAQDTLKKALNNPETTIELDRHTSPSIVKVADTGTPSPGLAPVIENEASKKLINYLSTRFQDMYVKPEQITLAVERTIDSIKRRTNAHIVDVEKVQEGLFDNYTINIKMGKSDGTGWEDYFSAEKFARTHGGTVVKDEKTDLFFVTKNEGVTLKGVSDPTEFTELSYNRKNTVFGAAKTMIDSIGNVISPEHVSKQWLNGLLKRGETKLAAAIRDVYKNQHIPTTDKLTFDEKKNINVIIENLRDGSDSYRRNYYNDYEFSELYYRNTGTRPRKEVIDGYNSTVAINDAAYFIEADGILKDKVSQRFFVGSFDKYKDLTIRAYDKKRLPDDPDIKIFDLDSGTTLSKKEFLKFESRNLFIVPDGIKVGKNKATYITGDLVQSRPLRHQDVLGYQPGGLRGPRANHFSVQELLATDVGGRSYFDRAVTWFAGFSEKEAAKATKDFNTIVQAVRKKYGPASNKSTLSNALDDSELIDLIRKNNGFNPSVESVKDLIKFLDEAGLELADVVTRKGEDALPEKKIGISADVFMYGNAKTYDDAYRLNANPSSATRNRMVFGYGGRYFEMLDPISGIDAYFSKSLNYLSVRAYVKNAMEGLIKGGEKTIENWDTIKNKSIFDQIQEARFDNSLEGKAFARERETIIERLNLKSQFAKNWEHLMSNLQESIFDKTGGRSQVDSLDILKKDPTVAARSVAYNLKFGFWNPQQYFVQFIGSALTAAVVPPKYGLKAFLTYLPTRLAMLRAFDKPFWDTIFSRIGQSIGMSKTEWEDFRWYLKESGRFEVNQTTAYLDTAHGLSSNSLFNSPTLRKVAQNNDIFFKEGEGAAVIISTNVAFREFVEKFPNVNIRSREGLRALEEYVEQRADALTLNMRRSSSAPWQKGVLGVATQWQAINARVLETLFFGRELSKTEKLKLVGSQVVMFGAAGIFLKETIDSIIEEYNLEPSPELYTFVKWGTLDGITQVLTGVPTNTADRLAFAEGMRSTIKNLFEGNIFQAIGGPVAGIGTTLWDNLYNLAANSWSGNVDLFQYDATKVFREISTMNAGVQAFYLWNYQQHITKNGRITSDIENPKAAAILVMLGAYLQEVNLTFEYADILKSEADSAKKLGQRARENDKKWAELIKERRWDDAREISNLNSALRKVLDPRAQKIFDEARKGYTTEFDDKISQELLEAGKFELDKILTNVTNPEGVEE